MANHQPQVKVTAGLDAQALCDAIATSRRLVLHAALYSNFALEPFQGAFVSALAQPQFERLDIITQDRARCGDWLPEFDRILRHSWSPDDIEQAFVQSDRWTSQILKLNPEKVGVHPTVALPCNPILLIDDMLFVGHYAHCSAAAPQGLWMQFDLLSAETSLAQLWHWAENGLPDEGVTDWQVALFRHVAECHHGMQSSK